MVVTHPSLKYGAIDKKKKKIKSKKVEKQCQENEITFARLTQARISSSEYLLVWLQMNSVLLSFTDILAIPTIFGANKIKHKHQQQTSISFLAQLI